MMAVMVICPYGCGRAFGSHMAVLGHFKGCTHRPQTPVERVPNRVPRRFGRPPTAVLTRSATTPHPIQGDPPEDDTLRFLQGFSAREAERAAVERRSREAAAAQASAQAQEERRQREVQEASIREARRKVEVAAAQAEVAALKQQLARLNAIPPSAAPAPPPPAVRPALPEARAEMNDPDDDEVDDPDDEGDSDADEDDSEDHDEEEEQPAASGSGWGSLVALLGLGAAALLLGAPRKPPVSPLQP
jgi:hypothetical protein